MTTTISFSKDDDVTIIRDGKLLYPPEAQAFTDGATPKVDSKFEKFGHSWKRNASDYEHAINELDADGLRFILREGDMRDGSDATNKRERAEISGSDFAGPLSGIYDFDFTVTVQAYDGSTSWSSLVQLITDDSDPDLAYQPLLKMQARPSEERITLNAYVPDFVELGSIPLLPLQAATTVRLTISFDNGYVRWAVNGETIHSGTVEGLDLVGQTPALVYPKVGAYRQGPVSGTAVNDFHAVSFKRRD